jgi:CheY-like chemotaxis protein
VFLNIMPVLHRSRPFILVVEDEILVLNCIVQQLEDEGFAVIAAADAQEALREFEEESRVTTVFTDINMPGEFDGLSLAHKVHRLRPDVQLILTSGRAEPLRSEMPPGVRFLPKPYEYRSLTSLIKAA